MRFLTPLWFPFHRKLVFYDRLVRNEITTFSHQVLEMFSDFSHWTIIKWADSCEKLFCIRKLNFGFNHLSEFGLVCMWVSASARVGTGNCGSPSSGCDRKIQRVDWWVADAATGPSCRFHSLPYSDSGVCCTLQFRSGCSRCRKPMPCVEWDSFLQVTLAHRCSCSCGCTWLVVEPLYVMMRL